MAMRPKSDGANKRASITPTTRVVNLVPRLLVKVQTKPENACFLSDIELQSLVNERPV